MGDRGVVTLLGATDTVTGSCTLFESPEGGRILVDVGLYQGRKELRLRNWAPFPVEPAALDAVVLTHAHVDHSGLLPKLVREGFSGPVLVTPNTARLAEIVLPDSGYLQEEEAAEANRRGYSKHHPALPLFTRADAEVSLDHLRPLEFHRAAEAAPGIELVFHRAGHILGAASAVVRFTGADSTVVMSGDLGRSDHPLLVPPDPLVLDPATPCDRSTPTDPAVPELPTSPHLVVCESTYGDRDAPEIDVPSILAEVIVEASRRGGVVVIPAFAVDRTEMVLHHLDALVRSGSVPSLPVVVDSPMASAALGVYRRAARLADPEVRPEWHGTHLFAEVDLSETRSVEESKELTGRRGPMVVVSASGMATGGRVLHHLAARMGDSRNTIVLVGFQAPGTRGARLAAGERTVKLLGAHREVAARVVTVPLSAHADRSELCAWLLSGAVATDAAPPRQVLVNHGERSASESFAATLAGMPQFAETRIGVAEAGVSVPLGGP